MQDVLSSILHREGITRFTAEEMKPFIYSLHGDLRRGITELQAAKASNSPLQKQLEIGLTEYNELLILITNKNANALSKVHDFLYDGKTVRDICIGLHDAVINADNLDSATKFKFLRTLGESEWRSNTMTPKVLVSWMMGQLL